ncbi:MAG: DUF3307 domain-containing protein [Chitinophagaceae bacterium]
MLTLIKWIFAHLLGDFVLQTRGMVLHKQRFKAASWQLWLHCLLHGILIYVITCQWQQWLVPVIVVITHFFIDVWKLNRKDNGLYFFIDQVLHLLVLLLCWIFFTRHTVNLPAYVQQWLQYKPFWIIGTGYLFVTFPLSYLLGYATQRWRKEAEEGLNFRSAISLKEAGKWIGIFERVLVYTFVITGHFEGIGFLIAAKSILRFNDIKGSEARKEAEYVLIGTLMSFSACIIVALISKQLLLAG